MKTVKISTVAGLPESRHVYIYGAGNAGVKLKSLIEQEREDLTVRAFIDSFSEGEVAGLPKVTIESFSRSRPSEFILVVASTFHADIVKKLKKMAFDVVFNFVEDRYKAKSFSSYPNLLSLQINTRCNIKCFFCNRTEGYGDFYDHAFALEKLKSPLTHASIVDLTGWGEPFIDPNFSGLLRSISHINKLDRIFFITTNGSLLQPEHGDVLRSRINQFVISLNAASEDIYNRVIKHGNFSKTLSRIKTFLARLDEDDIRRIRLHFVASTLNYKEIPDFVALADRLGIRSVSIGNVYLNKSDMQYSLLNVKEEYNDTVNMAISHAKELDVTLSARKFFSETSKTVTSRKCKWVFDNAFIGYDGDLKPCCWLGGYEIGNVYKTSFEEVWFGEKMQRLRASRKGVDACSKCNIFVPFDDVNAHLLVGTK